MYCSNCGHELHTDATFCSYCGKEVKEKVFSLSANDGDVDEIKKNELKDDTQVNFWGKRLNRIQFLFIGMVMLIILGMLRNTAYFDSMEEFYVGFAVWYVILCFFARLRCNHIGASFWEFIVVCVLLLIPLISLISWGYLLFKKGGVNCDEG